MKSEDKEINALVDVIIEEINSDWWQFTRQRILYDDLHRGYVFEN